MLQRLQRLLELRESNVELFDRNCEALNEMLSNGATTNDILVNGIVKKYFSGYFTENWISGFNFEDGEYYADLLNNIGDGLLVEIAKKRVGEVCDRYSYSPFSTCNLSGMAKLRDGSDAYVCLIISNIVDRGGKYAASSVFCFTYTDESMETPVGTGLYCFYSHNNGVCVSGEISEFFE